MTVTLGDRLMNRHACGVPLGVLLVLSVLISACAGPRAAENPSMYGSIKPWSYFGTSPKAFWWYDKVQVGELHNDAKKLGDKRTVAILDSGFLKGHEAVDPGNVDPNGVEQCTGNQGKTFDDISGHGTALAGIAMGLDRGAGIATGGVAPKAKLLTIKVVCGVSNADRVVDGVKFAATAGKNVDVILLALGPWPSDVISGKNVHQRLAELVPQHPEILFVVASVWDGKTIYTLPDNTSYTFPPWTQQNNHVLLVAGMTLDGTDEIEYSDKSGQIWAPARDVETASIEDPLPGMGNKHPQFLMQGTSAAAAIVAGCAAAVKLDTDTGATLKDRLVRKAANTLPGGKPRLNCLGAVTP
jgi:subtilisin family serine protease